MLYENFDGNIDMAVELVWAVFLRVSGGEDDTTISYVCPVPRTCSAGLVLNHTQKRFETYPGYNR